MKKHCSFVFLLGLLVSPVIAQQQSHSIPPVPSTEDSRQLHPGTAEYEQRKMNGTLPPIFPQAFFHAQTTRIANNPPPEVDTVASGSCSCIISPDSSFSIVPMSFSQPPDYRNDDDCSALISLPFNFCFYGQQVNGVYINNNGNISFATPYSTFTANGFPDSTYQMIAPFWADVDSRDPGSGLVYYKLTPTALIVRWDHVGYYNMHVDKVNDFQLIITDGTDSLVPGGNNVQFCYGDMQWTTGDASSGTNGFGGTPATVGINQGNTLQYFQAARLDGPGYGYDGAYNNNDSIDFLDYQHILINTCSSSNIPPLALDTVCDTIPLYVGSTISFNTRFLSPENNETASVVVSAPGVTGYTVLSNNSGNHAEVRQQFVASNSNLGYNDIWYTATDNGSPAMTRTFHKVIHVMQPQSVNDLANDFISLVAAFPNPSEGAISLKWFGNEKGNVSVYDISGKEIFSQKNLSGESIMMIPGLMSGVYLVRAVGSSGTQNIRVIVR